eukprot:6176762-Prymnesium_polylepis.1
MRSDSASTAHSGKTWSTSVPTSDTSPKATSPPDGSSSMYACGWKPESSAMHATAASAMPRTLEKS